MSLPVELIEQLQQLADREGKSVSAFAKDKLTMLVQQEKPIGKDKHQTL